MQFPYSWLQEFCNPSLSAEELADRLTMAGLEVETLRKVAPAFSGVVVGEIKTCVAHPAADRLRVCQVDVATGTLLNIVCGAPNARAGIRVPCALIGARLPPAREGAEAWEIKLGTLRGVQSEGMLCSAKELGVNEGAAGLYELAPDAPVGQDIREYLQLNDVLFTLKLSPNLAHCLSVYGVAREVSAIAHAPLRAPVFKPLEATLQERLPVRIEDAQLCGRFSGRMVRGVNSAAATPQWMRERLERCGQRSVNALVDISNYVMFELGRPSHIFDLDRIHGGLVVRWARAGETLKLLNGQTVVLDEEVGVIADTQAVESLAGIMGGEATAVSASTTNIYIEAAFWHPVAIAGRARRFNFSTEAAHRFERGVDPQCSVEHIERITQLVVDICGTAHTRVGVMDDHAPNIPSSHAVTLRITRASRVSGMRLDKATCVDALRSLGLAPKDGSNVDEIVVTPPSYRFDIRVEEDLIEEVIRALGYDKLATSKPLATLMPRLQREDRRSTQQVRSTLASLGYQETINFSFVPDRWEAELAGNDAPIRLLNPIAAQMNVMRSSLIGSLLAVARYNQDRRVDDVRVFELARVFMKDTRVPDSDSSVEGVRQPMRVAALALGNVRPEDWQGKNAQRSMDFYDIKSDLMMLLAPRLHKDIGFRAADGQASAVHAALHPGRAARVYLRCSATAQEVEIGVVGQVHPGWEHSYGLHRSACVFELDLQAVLSAPLPQPRAIPKTPWVQRDLAVVVKEAVTHAQLMDAIESAQTQGLLQEATLFDVYRAPALSEAERTKSLAVRLTIGHLEETLTDAQIEQVVSAVLASMVQKIGARLR